MLSLLAPLCDCGLLVPSALPCAEAALPGGGNTNACIWRQDISAILLQDSSIQNPKR